jgi:drug/metabolite transporter (DMT)-like permease
MKTAIVLSLAVCAQAVGNTCLSKGMKEIAAASRMGESFSPVILLLALESPLIWLGILLLLLFFALFAAALTWADLSFVLPASSFGYILNVALAHRFLGEPVSPMRWAGTGLIIFGVILVAKTAGKRQSQASIQNGAKT